MSEKGHSVVWFRNKRKIAEHKHNTFITAKKKQKRPHTTLQQIDLKCRGINTSLYCYLYFHKSSFIRFQVHSPYKNLIKVTTFNYILAIVLNGFMVWKSQCSITRE